MKRKKVKRTKEVSQAMLDQRMREIWIDGFGLLPTNGPPPIGRIRLALRRLVQDDEYWKSLTELVTLKQDVEDLRAAMKKPR